MNSTNGWTAEDGGRMRQTVDGGQTWTYIQGIPQNVRENLRGIYILTSLIGWVVGDGGVIMQTTDGGVTWIDLNSANRITNAYENLPTTPCGTVPAELYDIFMTSPQDGWVVGNDGVICYTNNNWTSYSTPVNLPGGFQCGTDPQDAYVVHFFGSSSFQEGIIASEYGEVYTTTDGGLNWTQVSVWGGTAPCPPPVHHNLEIWDLVFDDPWQSTSPGWCAGGVGVNNGYLYRTTNGGKAGTWSQSTCYEMLDPNATSTLAVCGISSLYAVATLGSAPDPTAITAGYAKHVLVRDTGTANFSPCSCTGCGMCPACGPNSPTWVQQPINSSPDNSTAAPILFDVARINNTAACLVGQFGRIARYENNVATDKATTDVLRLGAGEFISATTGCVIGQGRIIKRTTNGGATWTNAYNPTYNGGDFGWGLDFSSSGTNGVAVGTGGFIAYSSDSGQSWTQASSGVTNELRAVAFVPGTSVVYAAGSGVVRKSTDGGQTWSGVTSPATGETFHGVSFANVNTGYVAGTNRTVYATTDGGLSWTLMTFLGGTPAGTIYDVETWGNGDPAVVVGQGGDVYEKSSGNRFTKVSPGLGVTQDLNDVEVVINGSNVDLRIAAMDGVALFRDAGTWTSPKTFTTYPLYKMAFQSSTQGFAVGRNFIVLEYN